MAAGRLSITKDSLGPGLKAGDERLIAATYASLGMNSGRVQRNARNNAPWQDQTGNARNGLFAEAYREKESMGIVLYHTMEYGIWLEVKNSGQYAIILPTVREMGPVVMNSIRGVMNRIG